MSNPPTDGNPPPQQPAAPHHSPVGGNTGPLPPTPMESLQNAAKQHAKETLDPRNREYHGRAEIGGINLRGNTTDGLDTDYIAKQIKGKIQTNLIAFGCAAIAILATLIGLAGLGFYIYSQTKSGANSGTTNTKAATAAQWDGKTPFSCKGNDKFVIRDVTAKLDKGSAITAAANCQLELHDVHIDAPTGLKALSHATITVHGGSIKGKVAAATALNNGSITFQGTKVEGATKAVGAKASISGP